MTWHSSFRVSAAADSAFPQCQRPNWPAGPEDPEDDDADEKQPVG